MTEISKRTLIKAAGWSVLAAAAALAGCGKKEEAPKTAAAPAASAAAAASAASAAPAKAEPLKVAFIYIGPVGDGGWTFAHDNGRKAVEKQFGDKVVTTLSPNSFSTALRPLSWAKVQPPSPTGPT